jgi:tRNA nucleotidyltransferase (CCA-adding enzyme)
MADYIYLLENRLTRAQQAALLAVRQIARAKGLTVFLVGGAVRDMTSGSPVRDLDVVVQGNALKLKKDIEKSKGEVTGESETFQVVFARFPGGIRMAIGSTLSVSFPKPGKPVTKPATILEDLRRRDFTANAMALSLNDGSYGLLMDPLNGVADIENRELRLVSNYGFIEDPVRMIRATRLMARLGWQMDEKTQQRYETGKAEGYISALDVFQRGYETEEIFHEEDPLRVLGRLEAEGWVKHLFPALSSSKANVAELERLREIQMQLEVQGIHPTTSAANFPFLTAKMAPKDVAALKKSFARQGFVHEIAALEGEAKAFATEFSGKGAATPSQAWKMLHTAKPEAVLWVAHTSKNGGVQAKYKGFFTEWAQAKQKIPYVMMQEMRITPELPAYDELLDKLFFELMDGKLSTPEEMKAYLEPYSPPAPPPPVHLRRARAVKKDAKPAKSRKKAVAAVEGDATEAVAAGAADDKAVASVPEKTGKGTPAKASGKAAPAKIAAKKAEEPAAVPVKGKAAAKVPAKKAVLVKHAAHKTEPGKKVAAKKSAAKAPAKKVVPKKAVPAKKVVKKVAPAKKAAPKKAPAKKPAPVAKKTVPAKKAVKPAAKKKR